MQPPLPADAGGARAGAPKRSSLLRALRRRELGLSSDFFASVYTALLPSNTFVGVDHLPSVSLRRFTPCGRFLITISDNLTDVVAFRFESGNWRPTWRGDLLPALPPPSRPFASASRHPPPGLMSVVDVPLAPPAEAHTWPPHSSLERHTCSFDRFFSKEYSTPVAPPGEVLARDFCLVSDRGRFLVLASYQPAAAADAPPAGAPPPALRACPLLDRFSLHLVEAATGRVYDRFVLEKDYVHLDGHPGVHIRRNLLCVLSLRSQTLHLVRVQEEIGRFVRERRVGPVCRDDDEHELLRGGPVPASGSPDAETGLGGGKRAEGAFGGLMQRLLAYIFRKYAREGNLRKVFRVLAQYSMLVMLKAQLLDDDHLLVQLGSDEGGKAWDVEKQTCFYLVYSVSAAAIVTLFENKSVALLRVLERCPDLFASDPAIAAAEPPRNTAETLAAQTGPEASTRVRSAAHKKVRSELSRLPFPAAMRNSSPYLDRRLFSYDLSRLNGGPPEAVRLRCVTVEFTSTRTRAIRLRLAAGRPALSQHLRMTGAAVEDVRIQARLEALAAASAHRSFLFHPIYPFVISVVAGSMCEVNFHVVGHD